VLAADGKGIPAPAALEQALPQARAAVQAVTIQIDATGVETETTASRLIDGLSAYGLKVVEKGAAPADVIVEAKASAENLEAEDLTWYWAHGAVRVKMRYGATGEVFQRFEEAGQEASRDPSTSVGVTVAKLADRAADHAFKVLTSNSVLDE
jgi:hypothetical protein